MSANSIDGIFEAFRKLKVLVVGDVMVDAYSYGSVKRISPEAPVPVVSIEKHEKRLGGAANVALNLQSLGAIPILCSVVGDDPDGDDFVGLLKTHGLQDQGIIKSVSRITTVKHRVISSSQHLLRIDSEEDKPLDELEKRTLINHIENLLAGVDLVIFEDYDKGCLDEEVILRTIRKATEHHLLTVADPKKRNFHFYKGCTLFKPNLSELMDGIGRRVGPRQDEVRMGVDTFIGKQNIANVLVTLSKEGIYYQNSECSGLFPSHGRRISDNSGAGDTVVSIAGLSLALGLPLAFIAEFANLGGGIVCEYQGVVPIDTERLKNEASRSQILADLLAS